MNFLRIIVGAALLGCCCGGVLAQEAPSDAELTGRLDKAWSAKNTKALAEALDAAWSSNPEHARKRTLQILASDGELFRPTALAALGRHADVTTLATVIRSTDRHRGVGERRWLTYALGSRPKEDTADILLTLAKDQDLLVRAAAVTSLMAYKDDRILEPLAPLLREHPAWKPTAAEDDQHVLQMAMYGGFESLTGMRPGTPQEARRAMAESTKKEEGKEEPETQAKRVVLNVRGKEYIKVPRFNLLFDLGPRAEISEARVRQIENEVLPATQRMIKDGSAYFGPLDPAAVRFVIADKQRFSSYAGNSFRPGVSQGNQIVLREMDPETMKTVLAHEYIHVLEQAAFPNQPRWLVEGMAESLSLSSAESVWNSAELRRTGIDKEVEKSVFSPLMSWDGSASSGNQESRLYKMAHLAIDSLRFGDFGDENVRLFLLMSRIGEGENPPAVLKSIYDCTPKELDAKLRAWLQK